MSKEEFIWWFPTELKPSLLSCISKWIYPKNLEKILKNMPLCPKAKDAQYVMLPVLMRAYVQYRKHFWRHRAWLIFYYLTAFLSIGVSVSTAIVVPLLRDNPTPSIVLAWISAFLVGVNQTFLPQKKVRIFRTIIDFYKK